MARRSEHPSSEWGKACASTDFRELFRYEKNGRVRVYNLRTVAAGAEIWAVSMKAGKVLSSAKKMTVTNPEEVNIVLEDVEHQLRDGGWRSLSL